MRIRIHSPASNEQCSIFCSLSSVFHSMQKFAIRVETKMCFFFSHGLAKNIFIFVEKLQFVSPFRDINFNILLLLIISYVPILILQKCIYRVLQQLYIFFRSFFSPSGVGFPLYHEIFNIIHNDPAAHQYHCGRCRI